MVLPQKRESHARGLPDSAYHNGHYSPRSMGEPAKGKGWRVLGAYKPAPVKLTAAVTNMVEQAR